MNKKFSYLLYFLILFAKISFGQEVSVSQQTGTANVTIPIYTVSSGQVSLPIALQYSATGVKTKDVENTAGMGWQLLAGGRISRMVRGIPDDCNLDSLGNPMYGWMSANNTGAPYAINFKPGNDNNFSTCPDETNDISNINTNMPYNMDTEPDMFYVEAPGLSCQMVWDRISGAFHPVSYQDLTIQFKTVTSSGNHTGNITSFTITNDKGIKYVFAAPESVTQFTVKTSGGAVNYFNTKYLQFQHGITYFDAWNLVSMTDPYGNGVTLTYTAFLPRLSSDPIVMFNGGSTTPSPQYTVEQAVTPKVVNNIGTTTNNFLNPSIFTFNWGTVGANAPFSGQTLIFLITGLNHYFDFSYNLVPSSNSTNNFTRYFLNEFYDANENGESNPVTCTTPVDYKFSYIGQSGTVPNLTTTLPDSTSNLFDYWGYYSTLQSGGGVIPNVAVLNPSVTTYPRYVVNPFITSGSPYLYTALGNRFMPATPSIVAVGSLNQITNAAGGSTTLVYESNDYYDVPSGSVIQGGGIRVKQIIESPGSGATNNITRSYSYVNPAGTPEAGLSSGEPISMPQYAFAIPYNGTATGTALYAASTAISQYDLSSDDHSIVYSYVTESESGAGSTLYNFSNPYTYWNTGAATVEDIARYSCSATYGPLVTFSNSYPFIPAPNYDFERGLLIKSTNFNSTGNEVSESDYSYQQPFSSLSVVNAFKGDDMGVTGLVAKCYNIYPVYFSAGELTTSVVNKVYDSNGSNTMQSNTVNYTYGSAYHKLLTQKSVVNSDNSMINTYYRYVKDFMPNSGATNSHINALYNLKQLNVNAPVESYQQLTPPGGTTVTTSANLTLYSPVTIGSITNYLPLQRSTVLQPDGTANFSKFSINTSAQTIASDPNYFVTDTIINYDNTGYPQTVSDHNKHVQSSYFDEYSAHPTVLFKNAGYNEVAFNDFDSKFAPTANTFTISGTGSYAPTGSHAGNSAGLVATTQTVTSSLITKNILAQNYIFSIWINNTGSSSGSLKFSGINTIPALTYSTGGWTYYEIQIPVSDIPNATFTLSFTSTQNISIDDILLYPDVAEVNTATYDPVQHFKIAATNTNGLSEYYTNDIWGRLLYRYDQDKNIVEKRTYTSACQITAGLNASFSANSNIIAAQPTTLFASNLPGTTYSWIFGDNTTLSGLDLTSETHTYANAGSYPASLTVSNPVLGTKTYSTSLTVIPPPPVPQICVYGVTSWNDATTQAASTATCGSNTGDNNDSYYTITSLGNTGYTDLGYTWKQSSDNGSTWTTVGTNSATLDVPMNNIRYQQPFLIECIVFADNAYNGTSNVISFTVVNAKTHP